MKTIPRLIAVVSAIAATALPCAPTFAEEALGRLFFTPERRQALDRQRQFNIQEKQEIQEDPTFTINGIVTRSSGKRTVWLNGIAQDDDKTTGGVTVSPNRQEPGMLTIQSASTPSETAKVGDTINRTTGKATGLIEDGTIQIQAGRSRAR